MHPIKTCQALLLLILFLSTLGLTACLDSDVDEQAIPWGRPKSWEGGAPGMGGGGAGGY
jgi:hypothetical protein